MTATLALPIRRASFGLRWSATTQLAATAIKLASTLILTRLLVPDDYALLGTAIAIVTTLEWFADLGVGPALIRSPHGGEREWLLVGWWINLGRGAALTLAGLAAALPLASFYHQPELAGVIAAIACRPFLLSLRSPAIPRLRRHLEYRALCCDEIAQTVIGTLISIAAAISGAGVWSLVYGTLSGAIAGIATSYLLAPLAPRWHWDRDIARHLARFGGAILLNTLAMAAWLNLDRLLGPRFVPLELLGLYFLAWNLAAAAEALVVRGTEVYFGLLARVPDEERLTWHHRHANRNAWIIAAFTVLFVAIAPLAVTVLYDARYRDAGVLLALLLARLGIRAVGQIDFQYLLAGGRVRCATLSYVIGGIVQLAILVPLAEAFGAIGIAGSVVVSTLVVTLGQCTAVGLGRRAVLRVLRVLLALLAGCAGLLIAIYTPARL